MKKFLSVVLSILFAICLLGTLLLSVVRNNFSYSKLVKMAGQMMKPVSAAPVEGGLFHPGDIRYSLAAYEELGDFSDFDLNSIDLSSIDLTNMDVNEIVQSYLDMAGVEVETEFIAEVLASPEVSKFVDQYVGEIVDYVTGSSEELNINTDDVLEVMNKSLDMYEEHTGEVVDRTGMKEAVESNVVEAKASIQESLDSVKEENAESLEALKQFDFFLSMKFFLICAGICLLLALLILLINRNIFAWLQYVFMPCFIDGLLIFIAGCLAGGILPEIIKTALDAYALPKGIYEGIWSLVSAILGQLKIYGLVAAVLGIGLFVLGTTLGKKTKKNTVSE